MTAPPKKLLPYRQSLAGSLLAAREAVMAPIRPMLAEAGVTEQQWRVLRVLNDSGPIDLKTLAESALLFGPSVTRILKDLVERDLVVRQANPKDGRGAIVSLSIRGKALIQETASHTARQLSLYTRKFGDKRLKKLIAELKALTTAIQ
ncbi:MAG TPA: homoprotocatechuate degradation operon regulator HpaR [Rhizomicrobium sp.]|jgi:homoprotocatechuate degradation regulator HpaR|nr:homoprotocatechuate degradation operon regulator HpaR [Rhizomicrobium sp.]